MLRILRRLFLAGITAWVLFVPAPVLAQNVCQVERKSEVGYAVDIDGAKYLAISRTTADEAVGCRNRLRSTEEKLREAEALNRKAEATIVEQQKLNDQLKQHVATLNDQIDDLKRAKAKLEALVGMDGLQFEAGVGGTNDSDVAGLLGVGYGRYRVWGYVQEGGKSGLLVGIKF